MYNIFKKKEKLKIDIYGPCGQLIDMFPPTLMKESLPKWFGNLSNKQKPYKTVKGCPGLHHLYGKGISLPLWSDYSIEIGETSIENIDWPKKSNQVGATAHDLELQAPGAWPGYKSIKFSSPWFFSCKEPVPFVWVQNVWSYEDPQQFTVVPGMTEFKYTHQTHINTLWKTDGKPRKEILKAGTPMVQLVPLTERPIELSFNVMTEEIFNQKFMVWDFTFASFYAKSKFAINKNET
jgi:hypothetical protein